ncbi:MAG: branched-chain amino acid ABC transporter permease [Acidimicrobiales bacterium]|jgi:branched-chain amino acid transport system permease protein
MTPAALGAEERPGPGPVHKQPQVQFSTRLARLAGSEGARRLAICVLAGVVLAIMTGPPGTNAAPTSGFAGALQFPRLFWFLGFGAVLFAVVSIWKSFGRTASSTTDRLASSIVRVTGQRRTRLALDAAIVAFGFIWVSWISPDNTWKGGVCIEIGFAFAAMELVVYLFESRSLRIARPGGYAILALYGVLAWMHNPVSKYLNTIGAVPHSRTVGLLLLWLALGLTVLEGLLFGLAALRKLVAPRRGRRLIRLAGVILVVYGWLMWTSWATWRASSPHSLAHWFASIHVLPHNRTAGLVVMAIGALVVVYALAGVATDLAGALRGTRQEKSGQFEFAGITKQAKFAYGKTAITIAALLVAIQWPLHMDPGIQSILTTQVAIYVLLAMGLNVVVGFAGLLDLGYIAFWAIGSYTAAYFTGALPIQPPFLLNPFWIIPFAIIAAMLTGVLIGTPTLRLRGDYLAIVTLGFGEIIEIIANNLHGVTGGPAGTPGVIPQFSVHLVAKPLVVDYGWTGTVLPYYYLILGVAVVFMVAFSFLEQSRVGRSWTAIREDEVAADSVGINALKYKVMAFAIGASTSGFAGVFFASQVQSLVPNDFIVQTSILVLVFVIFGGMGSIAGAVIGAAAIQWLPQYLQVHSFQDYQFQDEFIYLGALLVLMMIFRPQGIIPSRRRRREILLTEEGVGHGESPGGPVRSTSLGETLPSSYGKLSLDEPGYIGPETQ